MVLGIKFHTLYVLQNLYINIWHSLQASAQPFFLKFEVFVLMSGVRLHRVAAKSVEVRKISHCACAMSNDKKDI